MPINKGRAAFHRVTQADTRVTRLTEEIGTALPTSNNMPLLDNNMGLLKNNMGLLKNNMGLLENNIGVFENTTGVFENSFGVIAVKGVVRINRGAMVITKIIVTRTIPRDYYL